MCARCAYENKRSLIRPGMCSIRTAGTQMYYDAQGIYHHHDPNPRVTTYRCTRGHVWQHKVYLACKACGYSAVAASPADNAPVDGRCHA